jgi:trigger factor
MQSQVSEISPVLVEVKVEVPWDRVSKDLESSFSKLARSAHVKGFRPGKVPLHVVKQLFKRQVHAEVAGSLVEQGLMTAVQKHEIAIVAQPQVNEAPEIKAGTPFEFKARIEVRPTIDKVALDGIEIFRDFKPVTDEQVMERIESLREQNADIQEPDPMRPAKKGDQLTIDYEVTVDGEKKPDMAATARTVDLGSGRLLEAFEAGLLGTSPGDSKQIPVEFPEDASSEELRGKTVVFDVAVKELRERVLPDIDDEFAKDVGDYEGLAQLKDTLRKELEEEAERRSETSIRDQIVDAVVEKNDTPVPPSLVQQQQQQMMREVITLMQITGQQPGQMGDFIKGMEQRAERRVKAGILLGAVARQENIEVAEADIEAKLAEIAASSGKHIAKVRVEYQGERRESLESQLLEGKLMAMLKERVTIKEGHPPEKEAADAP